MQLLFHLLDLMLAKLTETAPLKSAGHYGFVNVVVSTLRGRQCGIVDELEKIINNMQQKGVIKHLGDGIEVLKNNHLKH